MKEASEVVGDSSASSCRLFVSDNGPAGSIAVNCRSETPMLGGTPQSLLSCYQSQNGAEYDSLRAAGERLRVRWGGPFPKVGLRLKFC